jgi:hypothetical protein
MKGGTEAANVLVERLDVVRARMAMHDVEDDLDAHLMR